MAEVAQTGIALMADVDAFQGDRESAAFWWLGQHSFILKLGGLTCYLDPYLQPSPARQTPPLFTPAEARNADLVFCSHDHLDHLDDFAVRGIAAAAPEAKFVFPRPLLSRMAGLGVPPGRLLPLQDGETLTCEGLCVTGVKAKHEFFDETPEGFPYLGFVLETDRMACYHSGDTLIWEGLFSRLSRWTLDVAFLPINGRDAPRYRVGCLGNMTFQEAVDLAGELGVRLAVPTHYDMFAMNPGDPHAFVDYLDAKFPSARAWVGRAGERVTFTAAP